MHRLVTEADETLQIVVRPAGIERMTLMAGIRSDRGIAGLQGTEQFVSVPMTPATLQWGAGAVSWVTEVMETSGSSGTTSMLQTGSPAAAGEATENVCGSASDLRILLSFIGVSFIRSSFISSYKEAIIPPDLE
jgi:hypothetical protein